MATKKNWLEQSQKIWWAIQGHLGPLVYSHNGPVFAGKSLFAKFRESVHDIPITLAFSDEVISLTIHLPAAVFSVLSLHLNIKTMFCHRCFRFGTMCSLTYCNLMSFSIQSSASLQNLFDISLFVLQSITSPVVWVPICPLTLSQMTL